MTDSTQSSQISSSQGFGDSVSGQNSAASGKASKFSDSFLSSSPVSLIQSPQDDSRAGQGLSMSSEGVSSSLQPCAQPGSSSAIVGSHSPLKELVEDVDSPLKDQREGEVETKGLESSPRDSSVTSLGFPGVTLSSDPFSHVTSLGTGNIEPSEGLAENLGSVDPQGGEQLLFKECHYGSPPIKPHDSFRAFYEVTSTDQDSPESPFEVLGDSRHGGGFGRDIVDADDHSQAQSHAPVRHSEYDLQRGAVTDMTGPGMTGMSNPVGVEAKSECEYSSLLSARTLDKVDPLGSGKQQGAPESLPAASSALPFCSEPSPTRLSEVAKEEHDLWFNDQEEAEVVDGDSSGESDDTVIEDTSDRLYLSKDFCSSVSSQRHKADGPMEPERQPYPTSFSYVADTKEVMEAPSRPGPKPEVAPVAGYGKPVSESPLELSGEITSDLKNPNQHFEPPFQHCEGLSDAGNSDQSSHSSLNVSLTEKEPQSTEWKPNLLQDSLYTDKSVQQLSEESIQSNERPPSVPAGSLIEASATVTKAQPGNMSEILSDLPGLHWSADSGSDPRDVYVPRTFPTAMKPGPQPAEDSPETASDPESIEPECSVSAATDSFVGFMRDCLNSRPPKEPEEVGQRQASVDRPPQMAAPFSESHPAVLLNLEQERLTICALKELGSSQEEGEDLVQTEVPHTGPEPQSSPVPPSTPKPSPLPSNEPPPEAPPVREVEGADDDEAVQLAARSLPALLTSLSVRELVYWRDPRRSGVVFGVSLLVLLSLATFSVISVVSYLLLAFLCVTITFRVYKSVIQAVQKSTEGHPFKALMEKDVTIPPETFRRYTDISLTYLNRGLKQMRRLFLVEDLVDSLKLAVGMWLMTYVGAIFNGITILILADILLFTSPLVYEKYKIQIDHYVGLVRTQVETTLAKLQEKLPGAVKRSKAE